MSNDLTSICGARLVIVPQPFPVPIGLHLAQASRTVERAFDAKLRAGFTEPDLTTLAAALDRLAVNAGHG